MNRILMIVLILTLQACSEDAVVTKSEAPLLVQLFEAKQVNISNEYEFPATVSAVKSVDLKFEVSGRLVYTNLVEGSTVAKGEVLARIDPAPFKRRLDEAQIRFDDAVRDLERMKKIFKKNVASQSSLDNAKSQYAITELALANAKQDFSYSTIKAPFDAVVGARHIENDSYISAGTSLANLQDRSKLYFTFDVPERIMTANAGNRDVEATAHIIGQADKIFDIYYIEHETTPNPITQTYGVTFALEDKATNNFYPGSRASVTVKSKAAQQAAILVPIKAIMGGEKEGFTVWRFNPSTTELEAEKISIASMRGEYAVIASGLAVGDKVVSAAVNQMSSGLKVKEYKANY